jgi:hypothetical protein
MVWEGNVTLKREREREEERGNAEHRARYRRETHVGGGQTDCGGLVG